jgi:hypothetical protein
MTPVMPAFNGVVPAEMQSLFPTANITRLVRGFCFFLRYYGLLVFLLSLSFPSASLRLDYQPGITFQKNILVIISYHQQILCLLILVKLS